MTITLTIDRTEYTMTDAMFAKLRPFEDSLRAAHVLRYLKPAGRVACDIMVEVYKELFHQEPNRPNGCGACEFELEEKLGRFYFPFKEAKEREEREAQPVAAAPKRKTTAKKKAE